MPISITIRSSTHEDKPSLNNFLSRTTPHPNHPQSIGFSRFCRIFTIYLQKGEKAIDPQTCIYTHIQSLIYIGTLQLYYTYAHTITNLYIGTLQLLRKLRRSRMSTIRCGSERSFGQISSNGRLACVHTDTRARAHKYTCIQTYTRDIHTMGRKYKR